MRRTGLLLLAILTLPMILAGCGDEVSQDAAMDRQKEIEEGNKALGLTPDQGD